MIRRNDKRLFSAGGLVVSGYLCACLLRTNKPPFSDVFMLVSSFFYRSVATNHQIAVASFAEIGRFSGPTKEGL
jgi:hypothetical protein